MSTITLEVPETIGRQLETEWGKGTLSRRALEALALEGYRSEALSAGQVAELLEMSVWETENFLYRHGAFLHLTIDDLDENRKTLERFLSR